MRRFSVIPLILLAMLWVFTPGCEPEDPEGPYPPPNIEHDFGEMTDPRDGQTYKTIKIGTQTWMAENLNYPTGTSWCYNNAPHKCDIYGRLYTWNTALTACPPGWSLPGYADWRVLIRQNNGHMLKSTCDLWVPGTYATNSSGWSGLPSGFRWHDNFGNRHEFMELGYYGSYWSSTGDGANQARYFLLAHYSSWVWIFSDFKEAGLAVRCLRD